MRDNVFVKNNTCYPLSVSVLKNALNDTIEITINESNDDCGNEDPKASDTQFEQMRDNKLTDQDEGF